MRNVKPMTPVILLFVALLASCSDSKNHGAVEQPAQWGQPEATWDKSKWE